MAIIDIEPQEEIRQRMMNDLKRALKKPMNKRHWVMVIDLGKCVGCHACTTACVAENHLPPGIVYRPVMEKEIGRYPNVRKTFLPRPCMQCDNPPCIKVCPASATWKRPDGIVEIDYDKCIGCRYCINACPYSARTFDKGFYYCDDTPFVPDYEKLPSFEYGKEWPRKNRDDSPVGNARKCTFCLHRVEKGILPACVTTCLGDATYFGDSNDPDSLVSALLGSPRLMRLKEEFGTHPSTFYLV
ncbi:4Fe-4S dicluster domain-containing protein [Dissulfurimicrobium hydrothermale]|uniref:4Fe-4S dicluster domain-containing protein n=1 Tax=Dissulfurimicrobium hydrothermale TaxID=1750598 RepID=UPI001EDBB655|nr:4Fe-4S dicluster domain-containing protein [Dissulfurimicrobium hydrothermale]UKL12922.1 4Fe-4S dicluster domain-containing protein [Dissulfurimicrobium hydrothermale]